MHVGYSDYSFFGIRRPLPAGKILSYLSLADGWYHGQGIRPKRKTVWKALCIARYAHRNLLAVDSAPGLAGEIQLALYDREQPKTKYLEVTVEPDGPVNVTQYENRSGSWEITKDRDLESHEEVQRVIDDFWREIAACRASSGYSQNAITIRTLAGSPAWPLEIRETQYQLSRNCAFRTPEGLFVPI